MQHPHKVHNNRIRQKLNTIHTLSCVLREHTCVYVCRYRRASQQLIDLCVNLILFAFNIDYENTAIVRERQLNNGAILIQHSVYRVCNTAHGVMNISHTHIMYREREG